MAKVESGVFPCYENQFAVGKAGTESATTNIANCEEFSVAFDNGVEEWTAFENEGWKSRLMTAKSITISVKGKRTIGDAGNDEIAELAFKNGTAAQLLDLMDYISNSFLMPFISLLTSILIGWIVGPKWITDEVVKNGESFPRAGLYSFMIRYVVPVIMLVLFLVSTGFMKLNF